MYSVRLARELQYRLHAVVAVFVLFAKKNVGWGWFLKTDDRITSIQLVTVLGVNIILYHRVQKKRPRGIVYYFL